MVFGAASASATLRSQTKDAASHALKRPASVGALHAPTRTAGSDDDIPGVAIPSSPLTGSLSATTDYDDVFSIALTAGQTLTASLTGPSGSDFRLFLYAPGTASVKDAPFVAAVWFGNYPRSFSYTPTQSGTYYLDVFAYSGAGSYTVTYSGTPTTGGTAELVLSANHLTVPYHGTVTLTGALSDANSGSLLPNRDVEWYYSYAENPYSPYAWITGGTLSSSSGEFSFHRPIVRRTVFILSFAEDSQYERAFSDDVTVMSKAKLTPPAVPSRVRPGTLTASWGTLQPLHTPAQNKVSHIKVYLQRYDGGRWQAVTSTYAISYRNKSSSTEYSVRFKYVAGKWRMRAVHQDSDHARTTSSWRTFTVN